MLPFSAAYGLCCLKKPYQQEKKFRVKKWDTDTILFIAKVLLLQTEYHTSESQSRVMAYHEANNRTWSKMAITGQTARPLPSH
ncbi:hypothetical protein RDI58_025361 [Solanum bulbocastanum]|uniref:Uncharacterized protein n=1 Tax=Solanum bulbocastanum TaxID=147425 RepID=A0AAN8T6I8_SOLBU